MFTGLGHLAVWALVACMPSVAGHSIGILRAWAGKMAFHTPVRRRITGKQPPSGTVPQAALAAELVAVDGLAALPGDARRQHVHWTMVATRSQVDVQPSTLSREAFWKHLLRCYQECYPVAESPTGCILQFGLIAAEKHRNVAKWADRCRHFHAACFTSAKHYWRKVRRVSAEKYHIQLNAVAHDCYSTMYAYLRRATKRKPLYELDAQPYHSPGHPQGDALKALLEAGDTYAQLRGRKRLAAEAVGPVPPLRSPFGVFFQWVINNKCHGAKGAVRVERDAVQEVRQGRPQLLEFVRKNSSGLVDLVQYCWSLNSAEERLERMELSRVDILLKAATGSASACANAGQCVDMYQSILAYQGIDAVGFRHSLYETFLHGRRKGNSMMLVGGKDTGKTTITQPAATIFKTMGTPQSDSFCPLQDARGFELYLWHDFRYNPGHPKKDEQGLRLDEGTWNKLFEGLPTQIGVAKSNSARADFVFEENAPFIFTGPFKLVAYRHGWPDEKETEQLSCRLKYWEFSRPAPENRDRSFRPCGRCWARWVLHGELEHRLRHGVDLGDFLTRARAEMDVAGAAPFCQHSPGPVAAMVPASSVVPAATATVPLLPSTEPVQAGPQRMAGRAADATGTTVTTEWFAHLEKLMDWRAKGFLSDAEFAVAKAKLGLHAD